MTSTPRLPLLRRVPPGVWTGTVWCLSAAYPVVEFVLLPRARSYSYSYPRDGLDPWPSRLVFALAVLLVLAGCALLRRRPWPAYGLVIAATVAMTAAWGQTEIPPAQFLGVVVALCSVAASRPRRESLVAAGAALGVLAGYGTLRLVLGEENGTASEPYVALTVVIAWLVGHSAHQARGYAQSLSSQAAAQAVTAERLRIARELHDMVAHSIGVIALQAGAARRVIDTQPAGAREALSAIESTGRETLAGLRRMLGVLRQAEPGEPHRPAAPDPAPGLAGVDRLAGVTSAAGVHVDVEWRGKRGPLPPEIDMAAYRIVQEALTNVVRHAGTDRCRVVIDCRPAEGVSVEVVDDGRGGGAGPGPGPGWGLAGMRERVDLLDGSFSAAPRPEGGFRVAALLPVPAGAR